jgi:hypothetical protein
MLKTLLFLSDVLWLESTALLFGCSRKVTALYSFDLRKLLEDVGRKKFKHDLSNNDINRAPPKEDSYYQATRHQNDLHKLL